MGSQSTKLMTGPKIKRIWIGDVKLTRTRIDRRDGLTHVLGRLMPSAEITKTTGQHLLREAAKRKRQRKAQRAARRRERGR